MRQKFVHFLSVSSTRPRLLVALATVVALAIGGTVAGYAALTTSYQVTLDGETREVSSTGDTVAEVLASEGIEITEHDLVAPELDEPVTEGSRIVVRFGRPVELTVDGETSTHWVTSTDVASALGELGTPYDRAELSTTRSAAIGRDGLALAVVTPKNLTLRLAGAKPVTQTVTALTVEDALTELGVKVGKIDRTEPALETALQDGDRVVFTDFRIAKRTVKGETVPFETVETPDDSMYEGLSETEREGQTGTRNVTYKVVFKNGKLLRRTVLKQHVLSKAVPELVRVGTASVSSFGGSSVWDRARPVRVRRQLGHQHRQRLLRRAAVQPRHLARVRRHRAAQPAQPRDPDRRSRPSCATPAAGTAPGRTVPLRSACRADPDSRD